MKLFAVYVGGSTETSRVELHDMCFAIGDTIEDCYPDLYDQWWGTPESLHIDCWGALKCIDGYEIELKEAPYEDENKLWFVNLGGYEPSEFTEIHKNVFVVAPRASKARAQALKKILDWKGRHMDYEYEIEHMTCLQDLLNNKGVHIHLKHTGEPDNFEFKTEYHPLPKD